MVSPKSPAAGLIVSIFLPGVGSMMAGKVKAAAAAIAAAAAVIAIAACSGPHSTAGTPGASASPVRGLLAAAAPAGVFARETDIFLA